VLAVLELEEPAVTRSHIAMLTTILCDLEKLVRQTQDLAAVVQVTLNLAVVVDLV
jgi:hypothetical protein